MKQAAQLPRALASSDLPYASQQLLLKVGDYHLRKRMITSAATHVDTINAMVAEGRETGGSTELYSQALMRTTDIDSLQNNLGKNQTYEASYIIRNPLAPVDFLVKTLDEGALMAIRAYTNPSTPDEAKRKLTPERAVKLIVSGGRELRHRRIRAFELVSANLWMMETPTIWDKCIQEAIAGQPQASTETLHALRAGKVLKRVLTSHPAYHGNDINTLGVAELLATNCGAAFTAAVSRPEFTVEDAGLILEKHNPERHVIGRILNRYSLGALYGTWWQGRTPYGTARDKTSIRDTEWMCPTAQHYYGPSDKDEYQEANLLCKILGNNRDRWEAFIALLPDWHGSPCGAAEAAAKI